MNVCLRDGMVEHRMRGEESAGAMGPYRKNAIRARLSDG